MYIYGYNKTGDNMQYLTSLNEDYKTISDFVVKKLKNVNIIYLESLISQDKINDYILKKLVNPIIGNDIKKIIPSPNIIDITSYDDLKLYLESGFTIIFFKDQIIAVETKGDLSRSISTPDTEPTIYGPKESLTENFQTNLGLIKRRIRSNHLKNENLFIGRYTKTISSIIYIDNVVEIELVNKIKNLLSKIDIDGINDINELKKYLNEENKNVFPAFKITERPDVISKSLLNGKIVILLDNSPYALIVPSFLVDFINPIADNYNKSININFTKILRFLCFFISILTPAIYISVITYNQEAIPTSLLINIQNQTMSVPFPAIIECLITLVVCEILRESDIRFPSSYGSAISILGALVLGEAAVSAGTVSPIMIIIVAITFISSLIFTDLEIISALRCWRFIFLIAAGFYGLYGVGLMFIVFLINICSYQNLGKPYLYPLAPFDLTYIKETIFKMRNSKRSKYLSKNTYKGES